MIQTYLINLDRNPERLSAMTARLKDLSIPFERVPAIDGHAMREEDFQTFIKSRPRRGKDWTRGKMGCLLSHQSVWQKIVEGDQEYAAVLEDDLHMADDLHAVLSSFEWVPHGADLVRLEPSTNRVLLAPQESGHVGARSVHRVLSTTWCTAAYIISKQAAAKLLAVPEKDHESPDHLLFCYEASAIAQWLKSYQLTPAPCIQDQFFHLFPWQIRFKSEIVTADHISFMKSLRTFIKDHSPITYIRRSFQGYRRIPYKSSL